MPQLLPTSFAPLAWANLAAQSAEQLSLAAAPIAAVLLLGAGAGETGLLATAQTLPFLLLSIPLGLLADRGSRRQLMIGSEVLRTVALLALFATVFSGHATLEWLAIAGFVAAIGTVGFSGAAPALVPSLVPVARLAEANTRLELARSVAFAGGPAIAGAIVAWSGASFAFLVAALMSTAAIVLLCRLPEPARVASPKRHPLVELRQGAQLVWHHALLRPVLLTAIAWNIAWFVLQAAYVPYAMRTLGMNASGVGITLACYGLGMVIGALLARSAIGSMRFGHALLVGPAVSVAASSTMVATLLWPRPLLAAFSFFLFGVGPILWTITSTTLRQTVTPGAMMGRVSSIFLAVNAGARPVGAALGAWVGATWGEPACLVLALAGFVIQAAIIFASPFRSLERLPTVVA